MFENQSNTGSNASSSIIKSGYDVDGSITGFATMRTQFKEALTLTPDDCTEEGVLKAAKLGGEYRGYGLLMKKASREKLKAAQAISQVYSTAWGHANAAAGAELNWQRQTSRGLEAMTDKMLDMKVEEQSHAGFATYASTADRLISY